MVVRLGEIDDVPEMIKFQIIWTGSQVKVKKKIFRISLTKKYLTFH